MNIQCKTEYFTCNSVQSKRGKKTFGIRGKIMYAFILLGKIVCISGIEGQSKRLLLLKGIRLLFSKSTIFIMNFYLQSEIFFLKKINFIIYFN